MGFVRAFLACVLVMCGAAWADDGVPNFTYSDDIGSLTLMQAPCPPSVSQHLSPAYIDLFKFAAYRHSSGVEMDACWFVPPSSGVVLFVYADGDTSGLPQHLFEPVKDTQPVKAGIGI